MNKVITINLNGNAYQLEEAGYEALRAYLDGAARRLEGNPDRDEIIADIEQAIADKCRATLGAYKTVLNTKEVGLIIEEMGPVEDASTEADADPSAAGGAAAGAAARGAARPGAGEADARSTGPVRRLYKIPHGGMSPGVCNGLAAYFNIDVSLVRFLFLLFTVFWGIGCVAYVLLIFLLPTARTPEEKAAAQGPPPTAQDFIRRAKEGYYDGMKAFADKQAHREWRQKFHREMRGWRRAFHHEMREHARSWHQGWAPGVHPGAGAWFALPFVSIARAGLALLWIGALFSLLATGAVFGLVPPAGIPVWAAVLGLFVLYLFLAWPLKALRRAYYWNAAGGPFFAPPFIYAFDAFVGIGFVVVLLWLAGHHLPVVHEAFRNIPPLIHEAVNAVKDWWAAR